MAMTPAKAVAKKTWGRLGAPAEGARNSVLAETAGSRLQELGR